MLSNFSEVVAVYIFKYQNHLFVTLHLYRLGLVYPWDVQLQCSVDLVVRKCLRDGKTHCGIIYYLRIMYFLHLRGTSGGGGGQMRLSSFLYKELGHVHLVSTKSSTPMLKNLLYKRVNDSLCSQIDVKYINGGVCLCGGGGGWSSAQC